MWRSSSTRISVMVLILLGVGAAFSLPHSPDEPASEKKIPLGAEHTHDEENGKDDLIEAGLFRRSEEAIRGQTVRGQTILDAPPFSVPPRKEYLEMYPCGDCHEDEPGNPKERVLEEEHEDIRLEHGGGRFWCILCHGSKDKNTLTSLKGLPIDFDKPYLLCGQCHFQRQKDWYFGGHGKRKGAWIDMRNIPLTYLDLKVENRENIGRWQGKRVILSCPFCHNPHSPSIKSFTPSPPPPLRPGLTRRPISPSRHIHVWEGTGETKEGHR